MQKDQLQGNELLFTVLALSGIRMVLFLSFCFIVGFTFSVAEVTLPSPEAVSLDCCPIPPTSEVSLEGNDVLLLSRTGTSTHSEISTTVSALSKCTSPLRLSEKWRLVLIGADKLWLAYLFQALLTQSKSYQHESFTKLSDCQCCLSTVGCWKYALNP